MDGINNFKLIRETYGATQEEIASAVVVNRATVSNWETGATRASSSNLEKLSIFYGIGPESFYDVELDEVRRQILIESGKRQRQLEQESKGERTKAQEFHELFESISFTEARQRYTFSTKVLLALADSGELDELKLAYQVHEKVGRRLKAIIELREDEERAKADSEEATLFELFSDTQSSGDRQ